MKQIEDLQEELNSKNTKIKYFEESKRKCQKLRDLLASKVFFANSNNENLEILMNSDVEELFKKYEKIMLVSTSDSVELQEITENLNHVKIKLKIQMEQRESYEKQHSEMMDILKLTSPNRSISNIVKAIRDLKDGLDQSETEHYTNAEEIINQFPTHTL